MALSDQTSECVVGIAFTDVSDRNATISHKQCLPQSDRNATISHKQCLPQSDRNATDKPSIVSMETLGGSFHRRSVGGAAAEEHRLKISGLNYSAQRYTGSWWKGCCFRPREEKAVLKDVTLLARSGRLAAILGNSGSGKTSLLDVISGRCSKGHVTGDVRLDAQTLTEQRFRQQATYVVQDDHLFPYLTVKETLLYTARLKYVGAKSAKSLEVQVNGVLHEMGISHVADSQIGGKVERGISGGERRRVSVATYLLQDSQLILLDEPTSGLDSFTAHRLIATLAGLARRQNKVILLTIHQPRSDILPLFDDIGLLSEGQTVYYGPRDMMVTYFTQLGYACPRYANPLDVYVDLASVDRRTLESETRTSARVQSLTQSYLSSDIFSEIQEEARETAPDDLSPAQQTTHSCSVSNTKASVAKFVRLTTIALERMYVNVWRDRSAFVMRAVTPIAFASFVWLFCWQLSSDFQAGVQDRTGVLYQTTSAASMVGLLNSVGLFPAMRDMYYRDSREKLYGCTHFLLAYFIHILPFHLFSSLGYSIWVYWGLGFYYSVARFFRYYVVVVIQQYIGELQTVICLCAIDNPLVAQSVSSLMLTSSTLYATGLFNSYENMLPMWKYLSYINYFKYSVEILTANEYSGLNFTCSKIDGCSAIPGELYLEVQYPDAVQDMGRNYGILAALVVIYSATAIVAFRIKGSRHLY